MRYLHGYYKGGTIHFVINNQIGFTTDFDDARSSDYCTSLAAAIQAPVLHVNGDDPEAVVKCVELATRFRQKFHSDIFIDMVCYRRHGHNEGDDPKFTQPHLYALIDKHPNPREVYVKYLLENGEADAQELAKEMEKKFWADLQERLDEVKQNPLPYTYQQPELWWKSLRKANDDDFDEITDKPYNRLSNLPDAKGEFRIYNSLLSEFGVLGFEYGYALANPNALVLWEAQFGDFANGAQTIIDQFIAAGEQKWNRMNGLVLLLPHGYEGQGPEHSSARLERFLQLCAENNMVVTNIT